MSREPGTPPPLPARLDPRRGRRRGGRVAVAARLLCGLVSAVLLAGSGWGWHLARLTEAGLTRTDAIPATGNDDVHGRAHAGREMNLLLVGMDSRRGLTAEQRAQLATGDPGGVLNTDTMILAHIPADGSSASFVSFPRDMYVSIPGHGRGKLNSAYADGYQTAEGSDGVKDAAGARLLIRTISRLSGLRIDHYVEIDLLGFFKISTLVGGVEVNLCEPVDDRWSGAHFPAGRQTISGADALKFVRQRKGLTHGDVDRVVRQQVYLGGLIRKLLSGDLLLDPGRQQRIVEQLGGSLTVDRGLDLFDLAAQMQGVRPGSITFQTVPGLTDGHVEGWGDVLQPPGGSVLTDFFASLTAGPAPPATSRSGPTVPPAEVPVGVLNGSGVTKAAAHAAEALTEAGFEAEVGGNASHTARTTIRYHDGDEGRARTLAGQVPGVALAADDTIGSGKVELVLGDDFNGVGRPVTPPAPVSSEPGSYATHQRTADDGSCIA